MDFSLVASVICYEEGQTVDPLSSFNQINSVSILTSFLVEFLKDGTFFTDFDLSNP